MQDFWTQIQTYFCPFERKVVAALIIIALGCAIGIWQSRDANLQANKALQGQVDSTDRELRNRCWSNYNGRTVLRALLAKSMADNATRTKPEQIQDPELRALLQKSVESSREFIIFSDAALSLENCEGKNPDGVAPEIRKLSESLNSVE